MTVNKVFPASPCLSIAPWLIKLSFLSEDSELSNRKLKAIVHDSVNGEVVSSTINELPPQA